MRRARGPRRKRRARSSKLTLAPIVGAVATAGATMVVLTAANTFAAPIPKLDRDTQAITAQDLAPAACNGLGLANKFVGVSGGAGNDLIVGTAGAETLLGNGGNDCILAGGGNDAVGGGAGTDHCDGGPGVDTLSPVIGHGCETQAGIP